MRILWLIILLVFAGATAAVAAELRREVTLDGAQIVEITNNFGKIETHTIKDAKKAAVLLATAPKTLTDGEIIVTRIKNRLIIDVIADASGKRIDLSVELPARSTVKVRTTAGEIRVSGDFAVADAFSETGTIAADVPLENLIYNFMWTASRPRFVSDVELAPVREKTGGRFVISGLINSATPKSTFRNVRRPDEEDSAADKKTPDKTAASNTLHLSTSRGVVLLNVSPNEVPSDLRERPLTKAAKAIIQSGDSLLTEAIRRASPKYFGDYARTLPPVRFEPSLTLKSATPTASSTGLKQVLVSVTDMNNRAVSGLTAADFNLTERGIEREIVAVEPTTAPFNLVLLLDVSGSVEYYVDFIRKAARAFVSTTDANDRIAIVIFNEDVKKIATFTTDKGKLSESLDTFDAGGGTAYYDAVGYVLADTLRPLRGERSAIVVLTDGDDNQSFLPFDALTGAIQESGALIYPLYVPSALIAASNADLNATIDPLRLKMMGLSNKAEDEGEKLARISGGVYYPIKQLTQIQKAYDDIVVQLRTAYSVTFKSDVAETPDKTTASPRLKVKVKRDGTFVKLGAVVVR